jgi:2-polyprenyl-3-methyl-5-hydroxy-6-metoxy-1,4-benzoquinol methylase
MGQEIITGNVFDKYGSKNPLYQKLMNGFFLSMDKLISEISDKNSMHILEAGCGEGYLAKHILNNYPNTKYIGFDLDEEMLNQAANTVLNAEFRIGNIYNLSDFKNISFDVTIVFEVMEHLDNPEQALHELKQLNTQYFLFSVPREPVWRMLNILRLKYLNVLGNTPGHLQHWNKKSFVHLLRNEFTILQVKSPFPWTMVLCEKR